MLHEKNVICKLCIKGYVKMCPLYVIILTKESIFAQCVCIALSFKHFPGIEFIQRKPENVFELSSDSILNKIQNR